MVIPRDVTATGSVEALFPFGSTSGSLDAPTATWMGL
jgi:hypothetical protein